MYLLILGANSEVAGALAQKFAQADKANLYMASRELELLQAAARDIETRFHVEAKPIFFDALDYASHAAFYQQLDPKPDGVILAFGYLGDQQRAQQDFAEARNIVATNFLGAVSILETIAADFERQGAGFIIGLSSVAGERGRQSNYIYGSAKGALTIYLSGLRHRLWRSGVRVITVLPGLIQTKMTKHLDLPERLTSRPEEVAEDIFQAYRQGKNVVYTKWFWKWIMLIIRNIPEKLFVRTRL
jgi:decaprenylphospho-beta-D-erythro-pentofuranosid-2-ulose 2-reductase